MQCRDWRESGSGEIQPLLAAEIRAWRRDLDWDVTEAWKVIEPARRAGQLPGFVACDHTGRPVGWTSFLVHRECLQVLAFVAPEPDVARRLVEAILTSPEAVRARSSVFCVRAASPRLPGILAIHGFEVESYRYLRVALRASAVDRSGMCRWDGPVEAMARLCARAYADATEVRAFAPNGTMGEWSEYVSSLVKGPGCGRFVPEFSFVVPGDDAGELAAAILMTDLGPSTAHVAQVAVDPRARGRGWARRLLQSAGQAACADGYRHMTLLVSASNRPAVALYDQLGFEDRASFVVATQRQPSLSTSEAWASGGVSTRR